MRTRALKLILVAAATLRFSLLASAWRSPDRLLTPDSTGYVELSNALTESGEFRLEGKPEIFRTPGYPFFLIAGLPSTGFSPQAVAALQIAVDVLLVYLTFLLGMVVCGERVGLWAAAFQATNPVAIASSVRILSDGLFAFLLTMSVLLLVLHLRTGRWWSLICSSVAAAVSCYVRPAGLLFVPVCLLLLVIRRVIEAIRRRDARGAGAFLKPAVAAGVMAAMLAPWVVRNRLVAGYWGFSSVWVEGAFGYQAPAVIAETQGVSLERARWTMEKMLAKTGLPPNPSPGDLVRAKQSCAREVLRENLWLHASIHARGDLAVWAPAATDILEIAGVTTGQKGTLEVLRREGLWAAARHYFRGATWALWLALPLVAVQAAGYLLALAGALRHVRFRMDSSRWLMLVVVLLFAVVPGPAGHPRFQAPFVPILSIVAGAGVVWITRREGRSLVGGMRTGDREESKN